MIGAEQLDHAHSMLAACGLEDKQIDSVVTVAQKSARTTPRSFIEVVEVMARVAAGGRLTMEALWSLNLAAVIGPHELARYMQVTPDEAIVAVRTGKVDVVTFLAAIAEPESDSDADRRQS